MSHVDAKAATWDEHPHQVALGAAIARAVATRLPDNQHPQFLDYGCDTGLVSLPLAGRCATVLGVDSSAGGLTQLAAKARAKMPLGIADSGWAPPKRGRSDRSARGLASQRTPKESRRGRVRRDAAVVCGKPLPQLVRRGFAANYSGLSQAPILTAPVMVTARSPGIGDLRSPECGVRDPRTTEREGIELCPSSSAAILHVVPPPTPAPGAGNSLRLERSESRACAVCPTGKKTLRWVAAKAGRAGYVDFDQSCGRVEWATGYAYTEIEDIHGREVMLGIGSDDGIRIWLNGKLVHDHEVGRGYSANTEHARVRLQPGTNRILVKLVNYLNGWGFGISLPKANF